MKPVESELRKLRRRTFQMQSEFISKTNQQLQIIDSLEMRLKEAGLYKERKDVFVGIKNLKGIDPSGFAKMKREEK